MALRGDDGSELAGGALGDASRAGGIQDDAGERKDANGIGQLMRLDWFRPVHCKSLPAQEVRALLTARRLLLGKLLAVEMSLRGILRGFGLKVGQTTRCKFGCGSWSPAMTC